MTLRRIAIVLAIGLSIATVAVGLRWNSWVAGGMDSYGYVSQAEKWRAGTPVTREPAADRVPWPNALETLMPLGYLPEPGGRIVPYYAPGLPLLMAAALFVADPCAVFWVVPLSAGVLVLSTFAIGRRVRSDAVGIVAAALVATSPIVIFMMTSPMSDVPAAAFWTLALALLLAESRSAAVGAGLSASVAILIRPNLVPLAGLLAMWAIWRDLRASGSGFRFARTLAFLAGVIPGCAAVAAINNSWYGSPLQSGPGSLSYLFSLENVGPNLTRYPRWFVDSQTWLASAGVLAVFAPIRRLWRTAEAQTIAVLFAAIVLVVLAIHCLFASLEEWWFLRYTLAAWPPIFVGLAIVLAELWEGRRWWMRAAGIAIVGWLCVHGWNTAKAKQAFTNAASEYRYIAAARLVRAETAATSAIFSMQHSGTLRYYGWRMTIRYDRFDSQWLDRAVDWLSAQGIHPYILLEDWERPYFRDQFAPSNRLRDLEKTMRTIFVYKNPFAPAVYLYDPLAPPDDAMRTISESSPPPHCEPPLPSPILALPRR